MSDDFAYKAYRPHILLAYGMMMSVKTLSSDKPVECVGVVCFRGDEVLLIKRGKPPKEGEWSIPGGRIEVGETEALAALRELFEETNIRATLGPKIAMVPTVLNGRAYHLHDYLAYWDEGQCIAGDDAVEAVFVPLSDLNTFELWPKTREIIELAADMRDLRR